MGVSQRLRFANLTLGGANLVVSLSDGSHVIEWTPIAKDGRDLLLRAQRSSIATHALAIGETRNFPFTPTQAGPLVVGVYYSDKNNALVALVASQRIDVAAP